MGLIDKLFRRKKKGFLSDEEIEKKDLRDKYNALLDLAKEYGTSSEQVKQYIALTQESPEDEFTQKANTSLQLLRDMAQMDDRSIKRDLVELVELARDYGTRSEEVRQYIVKRPNQKFKELAAICIYLIEG